MKHIEQHIFRDGETLDHGRWNESLINSADAVNDNLDRRYTRSTVHFDLNGIDSSTAEAERRVAVWTPASSSPALEIEQVTLTAWGTNLKDLTVSSDITGVQDQTVTMAGTDPEDVVNLTLANELLLTGSIKYITVEVESGGTLTRGYLAITFRGDRGAQGASPDHSKYEPTLLHAETTDTAATFDAAHTAIAAAATNDSTNVQDLRLMLYVMRNSTTSRSWKLPTRGQTIEGITGTVYSSASAGATFTVEDSGGGEFSVVIAASTGTRSGVDFTSSETLADDLLTGSGYWDVDITVDSGTVELAYLYVWMS